MIIKCYFCNDIFIRIVLTLLEQIFFFVIDCQLWYNTVYQKNNLYLTQNNAFHSTGTDLNEIINEWHNIENTLLKALYAKKTRSLFLESSVLKLCISWRITWLLRFCNTRWLFICPRRGEIANDHRAFCDLRIIPSSERKQRFALTKNC